MLCIGLHLVAVSDRRTPRLKSLISLDFWRVKWAFLSDGVMVAQRSLEPLVVVRIHVGQPVENQQIEGKQGLSLRSATFGPGGLMVGPVARRCCESTTDLR